ncbi:uncharacterized protein LOC110861447 isoform X2 [Folsomia candida]|uniref:uncharacterized protein LOC110861447 isoform X2 n=1 Tax=Folsomia candida TaxID=158441 RepID=UPI001605034C|nr:uncharacterized protein LOC110861447 isoform X2 [Folsomia candida]
MTSSSVRDFWLVEIYVFVSVMLTSSHVRTVPTNASELCGHIQFGSGNGNRTVVNVFENQGISSSVDFEQIYNKFTNASALVGVEKPNCFIEICGNPTILEKGKRAITASCTRFWDHNSSLPLSRDPFELDYEATSITCGCQKVDTPYCANEDCRSRSFNETCAVLYQEEKCRDCIFDGIVLPHNGRFNTSTNAVIRSSYVQPGCLLMETAFGYSEYAPPEYPVQDFIPFTVVHKNSTNIVPTHTRRGQNFFCTCPELNAEESLSTGTLVAWVLGSIVLLVFLVTGISIFAGRRYRPTNKAERLVFPKSEILQFQKGFTNTVCSNVDNNEDSPGVMQACCAPYKSSLEIPRDDWEFNPIKPRKILGNGMFGVVFQGKYKNRKHSGKVWQDVAIKTMKPFSECGYIKSILNELKVLAYLGQHPNIVQLVGSCTSNLEAGEIYIILELCSNGSLKNYLVSLKDSLPQEKSSFTPNEFHPDYLDFSERVQQPRFPELSQTWLLQLFKWSKEIATGMLFLTEKDVLHIDLAARNVLLTEAKTAKIGDFGLSRACANQRKRTGMPDNEKILGQIGPLGVRNYFMGNFLVGG